MSFGLAKGREFDSTGIAVTDADLPPLPDSVLADPEAGRIDPRAWFPDPSREFEIEIGCGKGTFLVQQAAIQPQTNFLGIEWAREFFQYAADRVRRNGLRNVRMLGTDGTEFLRWRVPGSIARVIHLYFPDPWPKTRHHRRRTVQGPFLEQARRVLLPGGELRIVTDHDEYWQWMQREFALVTGPDATPERRFERREFERPPSAGEGELVGTNFERKYRREGRPFNAVVLRKPD
ncbi:MAG: tRNA (guanosine(46)-N7)-methyltransferase TrmB [Phycisphaeraceae bacterium]|nr:tRNA (guanosine(46)-N7)-methyltransferase TrmB [Phycisphaeraceae bacterium]